MIDDHIEDVNDIAVKLAGVGAMIAAAELAFAVKASPAGTSADDALAAFRRENGALAFLADAHRKLVADLEEKLAELAADAEKGDFPAAAGLRAVA